LCCEILQLNPDLRRVWPFGGIFCLTFFREGCSPAAPLDKTPLITRTKFSYFCCWKLIDYFIKKLILF